MKFSFLGANCAFAFVLALCATDAFNVAFAQETQTKQAKNVILFIGDGMGFNSDLIGTYWRYGEPDAQTYSRFPVKLAATTFAARKVEYDPAEDVGYSPEKAWESPDGVKERVSSRTTVTDSAAAATALNCGETTLGGRISFSKIDEPLRNFADLNYEAGRSVGVVTSVQISHATPAGASAHNVNRNNYEEISREQIAESQLTVLFGAGNPEYNNGAKIDKKPEELNYQFVGGRDIWEAVSKNEGYRGWSFIDERSEFAALAAATPDTNSELPKRVLGVGRSNGDFLPVDGFPNDEDDALAVEKYSRQTVDATPTLTEMTLGALNVLQQNETGFYLMVEGGAIDHANHSNNAPNSVLEHAAFSKAIDAAIAWVEKYSSWDETLMIITADHETGQIWGAGTFDDDNENGKYDDEDAFNGFQLVEQSAVGVVPDVQFLSSGHTNSLVPVYIKGAGAERALEFVRGNDEKAGEIWNFSGDYIGNYDLFRVMFDASGLKK